MGNVRELSIILAGDFVRDTQVCFIDVKLGINFCLHPKAVQGHCLGTNVLVVARGRGYCSSDRAYVQISLHVSVLAS